MLSRRREEANAEVLGWEPDDQRRESIWKKIVRSSSRELSFDPLEQRFRRRPVTAKLTVEVIHEH